MLKLGSQDVRKAYIGTELVYDNDLPYTSKVEYLQATGNTTWINTGYVPNRNDVRVVLDAEGVASGDFILYSIQGTSPRLSMNWFNGTKIYFRFRDKNLLFTTTRYRHVFDNGEVMKIDGSVVDTPTYSDSVTFVGNTKKLALFGAANAAEPTAVTYAFTGKVYRFSVYEGDDLVLDYIPVRVGNVGCMYDNVSGEIAENSGTGAFTYGNDV